MIKYIVRAIFICILGLITFGVIRVFADALDDNHTELQKSWNKPIKKSKKKAKKAAQKIHG